MDRLWTPWRFDYISNAGSAPECVFCTILSGQSDESNLVLRRDRHTFALLNLFPYTSGHILVVANRHITFLAEASPEELAEFASIAQLCEGALRQEYHPDGFNIGFNLGKSAGAGVAHHLHMHVVPRWTGDANFISVIAETRVLPEDLPRTYRRLLPYLSPAAGHAGRA